MKKLMKWPPNVALALLLLLLPSCALVGTSPEGLKGLKVEKAAAILHLLADQIEMYDVDEDGLISGQEVGPLGVSAALRLYAEMRKDG